LHPSATLEAKVGTRGAQNVVVVDPETMGGEPIVRGTQVPIQLRVDWLEDGETLASFLRSCPSATRNQVSLVLRGGPRALPAGVAR
jgi:uncharacterized protein (DUF433 family)